MGQQTVPVLFNVIMLTAKNLFFSYDENPFLQNLSLTITPGKVTVLIGPNGAGKSTLLYLLTGALSPKRGTVLLEEKPLSSYSCTRLAQKRAVLPQESHLPFNFQVEEIVLLGCTSHHYGQEKKQIVQKALEWVDMASFTNRLYTTLSGGEKRRVHLARTLAQMNPFSGKNTSYLLLDEPVSHLDLSHQHQMLKIAQDLAKRGQGVFCILHDLNLAALYADFLYLMDRGEIVTSGSVSEVYHPTILSKIFQIEVEVFWHKKGFPYVLTP